MCCDLSAFSLIKIFNNRFSIRKVSEVMYAQEIEMIDLQLKNSDEKSQNIILMNVYLMSNMGLNLFSIETVKTKEISVKIKNRLLCLKNKVKSMLNYAVYKDKLYYLQILTTRKSVNKNKTMSVIKDNKILRAT